MSAEHTSGRSAAATSVGDVVREFERAFRGPTRPRIEDVVAAADAKMRPMLLVELAIGELELRRRAGEPATADEYLARFPDLARRPEIVTELRRVEVMTVKELPDVPGYDLHGELARGGMGVVYRATDRAFGREVAVKVMRGSSAGLARRFVTEAMVSGQLQHPGIPPVYQVGELADGRPYLAMKLVKGATLASVRPANPVAVFEAICQAVGYAHSRGGSTAT
jgi:hypothetical protein